MDESQIIHNNGFKYVESTKGTGTPIVLLHGLLGALSNFTSIFEKFSDKYVVVLPLLPIFDISFRKLNLEVLVDYIEKFIEYKGYEKVHLLGNSLGGHLAQLYTLKRPERVASLILTGSSGLFESAMGNTFPKRGNYEYIRKKAESVFYNPEIATKELVDEVYGTVNDLRKAMSVVSVAKSAVRHNLENKLHLIKTPVLLVWGVQDSVTPFWVGEKFHELLPNSRLIAVDKCGHAPMMECPEIFNKALDTFIQEIDATLIDVKVKERLA